MVSLFRRTAAPARRTNRVVLRLEGFEIRVMPDGDPTGQSGQAANQAPQIVDFRAQDLGGGIHVITGRVIDESPGGLTVCFGGSVPTLYGMTATTNADGTFTLVVRLKTDGSDIGCLTAKTQDAQGLWSAPVSVSVHPTPG